MNPCVSGIFNLLPPVSRRSILSWPSWATTLFNPSYFCFPHFELLCFFCVWFPEMVSWIATPPFPLFQVSLTLGIWYMERPWTSKRKVGLQVSLSLLARKEVYWQFEEGSEHGSGFLSPYMTVGLFAWNHMWDLLTQIFFSRIFIFLWQLPANKIKIKVCTSWFRILMVTFYQNSLILA